MSQEIKQQPKPRQQQVFKQTFIRNTIYIRRRDYDGVWEVVQKLPYAPWNYQGRGDKQTVSTRWMTVSVFTHRQEALEHAKELGEKNYSLK